MVTASDGSAGERPATVTWWGHSTVVVELDGARILTDPLLRDRVTFLRRVGAGPAPAPPGRVDAVVVSHLHHDHLDLGSLRLLPRGTTIVVPVAAREWLRRKGFENVVGLRPGESAALSTTVSVTAVEADHRGSRVPFGPHGVAMGFIVTGGGRRVYFAGDTAIFDGMRAFGADGLDCALLPVWGWGTSLGPGHMDPGQAADAVRLLDPGLAVPVHWGTFLPFGTLRMRPSAARLLHLPPVHFAAAVRGGSPRTRVVVPEPGVPISLDAVGDRSLG